MNQWPRSFTMTALMSAILAGCGGSSSSSDELSGGSAISSETSVPQFTCSSYDELSLLSAVDDGSFYESYSPDKAIDGKGTSDSHWSSEGAGKELIIDLGTTSYINMVSILWYQDSDMQREYAFEIMVSEDGKTWQSAPVTKPSSVNQDEYVDYDIDTAKARYVKVIGQENNVDNFISITEIKVKGCGESFSLDPMLPPSSNFDLSRWYLGVPIDLDNNGKSDSISEETLNNGYQLENTFYTNEDDGGMVFRVNVDAPKTSTNTSYARTELREMLRQGDTSIKTQGVNKNNWVFSSAPESDRNNAGGIDGVLEATLAVNHVTTTGDDYQKGRVIIGQIHANDDEPVRLYYRKLPNNSKGSIYFAHESRNSTNDAWHELIGSKSDSASNPSDGIALNEKFSYQIKVKGNALTVTISRVGKNDVSKTIDMSNSGYDNGGQYMYFKAGVYNQNNSGNANDYVQATFYSLEQSHN
ncbi:polysaccharide lyase family 7 protein [Vibrio rumoiensis]|uniref:Cyclic nucleotide-binding protein n=1 Tax=Vibrio rumoiensis 1S-45 TaxID=1188252 RepID=A0A1E5DZE6_9VIBR|nr:polysaccharide lyase family 7 protein [Vibrio rumoiensis]OEF23309.1 cyclic nucleotide-binding protein [Vibrio rumoiensis 1S-45]